MKLWTKLTVMLLTLLVLLGAANVALAAKEGDFEYKIENGKAIITDYTGNAAVLTIPTRLGGKPVVAIGYMAFYNCRSLTSVTIKGTVTSIDKMAFYSCANLTNISISDSVISIGADAFAYCTSLTTITIPASVTSIRGGAFYGCTSLTTVITNSKGAQNYNWGSGVMVGLFEGDFCYQITNGNATVSGYTGSSTRLVIPNRLGGKPVSSIGSSAFSGCTSLTTISIPDSVTRIGEDAFSGCTSLTSIAIPSSVTSIGASAFAGCSRLITIDIPVSVTSIDIRAFSNCTRLTTIAIPNSVTAIRSYLFSGCASLTTIIIPDSVTRIEGNAFEGCTSLNAITIPDSVTRIGEDAFSGCTSLTTVNTGCAAAQSYPWPAGVRVGLGDGDFSFVAAGDTAYCLMSYSGDASVVIVPSTYNGKPVTQIDSGAFGKSVTLFVTGETPFVASNPCWRYAVNADGTLCLTGTNITDARLILPGDACGTAVTAIGDYAFMGKDMSFVYIPDSIVTVGENPFRGCTKLATIVVNPENAGLYVSAEGVLYSKTDKRLVCFPAGLTANRLTVPAGVQSIGAYAMYKVQAGEIVLPDSLTGVGVSAFAGNDRLVAITLPDGISEIPAEAFSNCTSLYKVTFPANLMGVGQRAFYNCGRLSSLAFPNTLTSIGQQAFYNCGQLTELFFPVSLTSIGQQAFYNCGQLTELFFPVSLTSIGQQAFYNCGGLRLVYIAVGTQIIGEKAFAGCGGLQLVTVPATVTTIGADAFSGAPLLTLYVQPGSCAATYARENLIHALYPDSDSWLAE